MKPVSILAIACSLLLIGCSRTVVTPNGSAKISNDGTKSTYQDSAGNKVESEVNKDGSYTQEVTSADGTKTTINSETQIDATKFGINTYPNITKANNKNSQIESEYPEGKAIIFTFNTPDSAKQVVDFYEKQCDKVESRSTAGDMEILSGSKSEVQVSISAIKTDEGTTVSGTIIQKKK